LPVSAAPIGKTLLNQALGAKSESGNGELM
jgi:hypothetical protein